jgi:hypothetical protein
MEHQNANTRDMTGNSGYDAKHCKLVFNGCCRWRRRLPKTQFRPIAHLALPDAEEETTATKEPQTADEADDGDEGRGI